jgi:DNA-binding GntR family transcriptional regulator
MPPNGPIFASKREFAYKTLHAQILAGTLEPSRRLVIDELAAELGVSPIPVREALQQLQADGLVVIEPYVGAHVSSIHTGLVEEVYALLEALEIISSQHACLRMSDEDFATLEAMAQTMDESLDDLESWSRLNAEFHQFIVECAGLSVLPSLMDRVLDQWQRLRRHYLDSVLAQRAKLAQQEHWQLLEALKTRDPQHVDEVIRAHNRHALASYLDHLTKSGQLDSRDSEMKI